MKSILDESVFYPEAYLCRRMHTGTYLGMFEMFRISFNCFVVCPTNRRQTFVVFLSVLLWTARNFLSQVFLTSFDPYSLPVVGIPLRIYDT